MKDSFSDEQRAIKSLQAQLTRERREVYTLKGEVEDYRQRLADAATHATERDAEYHEGLMKAREDVKEVMRKHERWRPAIEDLIEELSDIATQQGCGCGHPACIRCEASRDARKVIDQMKEIMNSEPQAN